MKAGRPGGQANPPSHDKGRDARRSRKAKRPSPYSREKPLGRRRGARTKTDSGGRVEHTEAIGGTVVKELGIIAP